MPPTAQRFSQEQMDTARTVTRIETKLDALAERVHELPCAAHTKQLALQKTKLAGLVCLIFGGATGIKALIGSFLK